VLAAVRRPWATVALPLLIAAGAAVAGAQGDRPARTVDADLDGLDDGVEDRLAERFAPIVMHGESETAYPVSVEWFLAHTSKETIGGEAAADARSVCKRSGAYYADVKKSDRIGERNNTNDWKTYVHVFHNTIGGVTIQYWRAYAWDQSTFLVVDMGHGGDWEGIAVHLNASLQPDSVGLLGHLDIERRPAREIGWEGSHPKVWSEEGGHATRADWKSNSSRRFTRQETWTGGHVFWLDGRRDDGGGLINVGEKTHPREGQEFIQYPGLWGSPHRLFVTSGYWGPAFNETGATCEDGKSAYRMSPSCGARSGCGRIFFTAWCDRMDGAHLDLNRECYAPQAP
jgi:hypothetical protein